MALKARPRLPIALTIAGSDSGGGAGIQADLKTFAALGVHGTSAITCVTAQNPNHVLSIHACPAPLVRDQLQAIFDELPPAAVKTGMLYSRQIAEVVADWFHTHKRTPLIVDPVMIATSGSSLLQQRRPGAWLDKLLPLATLVTPNLDETGVLLGGKNIRSVEEMRSAARAIHARFGCAVLVKGGHLHGLKQAVDVLYSGQSEYLLAAPFIRGISTHGTGCTYSAAITAGLAHGCTLIGSVRLAKEFITQALARSYRAGRHQALNCAQPLTGRRMPAALRKGRAPGAEMPSRYR